MGLVGGRGAAVLPRPRDYVPLPSLCCCCRWDGGGGGGNWHEMRMTGVPLRFRFRARIVPDASPRGEGSFPEQAA